MNVIVRILVGGVSGWLTGKALEIEGRVSVVKEGHLLDVIYGVIGAMVGEYLFFWVVIGEGDALSSYGTTVLGSIALVGAFRYLVARLRPARS